MDYECVDNQLCVHVRMACGCVSWPQRRWLTFLTLCCVCVISVRACNCRCRCWCFENERSLAFPYANTRTLRCGIVSPPCGHSCAQHFKNVRLRPERQRQWRRSTSGITREHERITTAAGRNERGRVIVHRSCQTGQHGCHRRRAQAAGLILMCSDVLYPNRNFNKDRIIEIQIICSTEMHCATQSLGRIPPKFNLQNGRYVSNFGCSLYRPMQCYYH